MSSSGTPPACRNKYEMGSDQSAVRSWQGSNLTADWSLPIIGAHLGAFFYWTRFIWKQCIIRQYHSNLSDQSAPEIRARIRVRLRVALF